jgi:hypothetical protein
MPNIDSWSTDQVDPTSTRGRHLPSRSPAAVARLSPSRAASSIVLPDLTLLATMDPEVIRLDKWIPLLCELHH